MAEIIFVVGQSGTGKTRSGKNLPPEKTIWFNVDGKQLPWKGSKAQYKESLSTSYTVKNIDELIGNDFSNGCNMFSLKKPKVYAHILNLVSEFGKSKRFVVIDDFQYLMSNEYLNRAKEEGWDKFNDIGDFINILINASKNARPDLKIFILAHDEREVVNDRLIRKIKTIGTMIDRYITLEGKARMVLFTDVIKVNENGIDTFKYVFQTKNDGTSTAKSPEEMFDEAYLEGTTCIPNDLNLVSELIDKYDNS